MNQFARARQKLRCDSDSRSPILKEGHCLHGITPKLVAKNPLSYSVLDMSLFFKNYTYLHMISNLKSTQLQRAATDATIFRSRQQNRIARDSDVGVTQGEPVEALWAHCCELRAQREPRERLRSPKWD